MPPRHDDDKRRPWLPGWLSLFLFVALLLLAGFGEFDKAKKKRDEEVAIDANKLDEAVAVIA